MQVTNTSSSQDQWCAVNKKEDEETERTSNVPHMLIPEGFFVDTPANGEQETSQHMWDKSNGSSQCLIPLDVILACQEHRNAE